MNEIQLLSSERESRSLTNKTNIPENQERTRSYLAIGFSILFGVVLVSYIVYAIFGSPTQEKNSLLSIILSATTGFVGTILGFYFGQNSNK